MRILCAERQNSTAGTESLCPQVEENGGTTVSREVQEPGAGPKAWCGMEGEHSQKPLGPADQEGTPGIYRPEAEKACPDSLGATGTAGCSWQVCRCRRDQQGRLLMEAQHTKDSQGDPEEVEQEMPRANRPRDVQ